MTLNVILTFKDLCCCSNSRWKTFTPVVSPESNEIQSASREARLVGFNLDSYNPLALLH